MQKKNYNKRFREILTKMTNDIVLEESQSIVTVE